MKYSAIIALLSFTLVACSGSKSAQKVNEDVAQIELSEADELLSDIAIEEPYMEDMNLVGEASVEEAPIISETPEISPTLEYTVQKNETLMLIAFKIYGDYEQWKQLANLNSDVLKQGTTLREGMTLKYLAPVEQFVWNPEGQPYLIKTGDTLGHISDHVYQTSRKWKLLWDNNRPLIKDPNKIFAGFTIYYPDLNRDVASEEL